MVVGLYLATFLASFVVLMTMLIKHKRVTTVAVIFGILTTIQSFGRYLVAISTSEELAVIGNMLVHVGGCFCPFVIVYILINLCNMKMPKWLVSGLFIYSAVVFCLVLSIGYSDIYYKNFQLIHENGYTYLLKDYGPAHILYPVLMIIYFCVVGFCLVYAIRKYKEVSLRTISPIVLLTFIIMGSYILERSTNNHVSFLSIGYFCAMLLFFHFINSVNMFDLGTNIANCIDKRLNNGYIEFDTKYRCVGYNKKVSELFPEVESKWNIDEKIPEDDSFLYKEVISWIYTRKKDEKKNICVNNCYYEMFVHEISYGKRPCVGYMLELIDRTEENRYLYAIENYKNNLEKDVNKKTKHISHIKDMMVLGMASMVESRDNSTGGHIKRTSEVMKVFSKYLLKFEDQLNLTEEFLEMVARAAPMHDLGKIAVDDAILRKNARFTDDEFEIMKKHAEEGSKIVRGILSGVEDDDFVRIAENVAHYHHEKWNGTGYPSGLKENNIPVEARLMALADVFDALVSKRCYKEAFSYDKAFSIIEESLGAHFDPVYGAKFIECRPELEILYDGWNNA